MVSLQKNKHPFLSNDAVALGESFHALLQYAHVRVSFVPCAP